MSKEILQVAQAVSNEKGVAEGVIFDAMEQALAMATTKRFDEDSNIRVTIDRRTGDYETYRWWTVVDDATLAELGTQFTLEEAHERDPNLKPGDIFEEQIDNVEFGRIAAQTAKQVIVQKVRDAERALVARQYEHRIGELLGGIGRHGRDDGLNRVRQARQQHRLRVLQANLQRLRRRMCGRRAMVLAWLSVLPVRRLLLLRL